MGFHSGWINGEAIKMFIGPLGGTGLPALTTGGVIVSMIYLHFRTGNRENKMIITLAVVSVFLLAAGLYTNNFWIVSKIFATPPWILLCSAITTTAFIVIYLIADRGKKAHWFDLIKPAGTNTLLCYLVPYFVYAAIRLLSIQLPEFMLTGLVGLMKSLMFALVIVLITGVLGRRGVQLKL
jgi:hypothetical protein